VTRTLDIYSDLIANLLAVKLELASQTNDRNLIRNTATFVALGRFKEAASQERGLVYAVASAGQFDPDEFQRFATSLGAQDTWRSQFDATASSEQRARLDALQATRDVAEVNGLRNFLRNALLTGNANSKVELDPKEWFLRTSARIDQIRDVENTVADDVRAASQADQSTARRQALLYTILLTLVLWITVGLSLWLVRSIGRAAADAHPQRQRGRRRAAPRPGRAVAAHQGPRDLDAVPEPVPVSPGDEIGQVSAAFNSVHRVAIQVATEQAALRRSIGDMFLNLARRSQSLIDRQLELIDDLDAPRPTPTRLDNLFKLDHLATRMRRNAEDLIVLSGAEPARRWSQPVPLVEVVRAALAEVEDYNRVELLPIDDIGVAGQAVSDVVHLLAELIENATSFSPPGTKVQVAGQQVSNGYVLEIEDRGLGMSDDELVEANERLANPPMSTSPCRACWGCTWSPGWPSATTSRCSCGTPGTGASPPGAAAADGGRAGAHARGARGAEPAGPGRAGRLRPAGRAGGRGERRAPADLRGGPVGLVRGRVRGDHLPLRRHAAQQPNGRAAEPTGNGAGTLTGAGAPSRPTARPGPTALARPTRPGRASRPRPCEAAAAEAARARRPGRGGPRRRRPRPARGEAPRTARRRTARPPTPRPDRRADRGPAARRPGRGTGPEEDRDGPRDRTGSLPTRIPGGVGPAAGRGRAVRRAPPSGTGIPWRGTTARGGRAAAPTGRGWCGRPWPRAGKPARHDAARARDVAGEAADAPATLQAASVQTTKAGLPRSVRGANLAPGGWSPRGPRRPPRPRAGGELVSPPRPPRPGPRREVPEHAVELSARASSAADDGSRRRCRQRRRRPFVLEERRR
jgi:signal transduction histidine kinase